jgi:glutamine amidotransferase
MTGIVDYNAGNIRSVEQALAALGAPFILSKKTSDLENCDRLISPGVGDAAYAMQQLSQTGFDDFLKEWTRAGKQLLGICLGSQIIFEHSEEGNVDCLGLLPGTIRSFESVWKEKSINSHLKVPHMGWNNITFAAGGSKLLDSVPEQSDFYFVHSYLIQPADTQIIKAFADYGIPVPACVEQGNITAFQFHPEKSGVHGLQILKNYCSDDLQKKEAN